MKLRLRGNSIRLRLTSREVQALAATGFVEERSQLDESGAVYLAYRIETTPAGGLSLRLQPGQGTVLCLTLPADQVAEWAGNPERVGIYSTEAWGRKVAVEKDFKCLDPRRDEDESDNYENPNQGRGAHAECHSEED